MLHRILLAAAVFLSAASGGAQNFAQDLNMGTSVDVPRSPILTIDPDRLFNESAYGQRIHNDLTSASQRLVDENRQIERTLEAEELSLTEQRAGLSLEAFRDLADAFDLKVSSIRRRQDNKARALQRQRDAERQAFFENILPVLGEIVKESGAVAIVDRSTVFLTANEIDITTIAIQRMDDAVGDGAALRAPSTLPPEPRPDVQEPKEDE